MEKRGRQSSQIFCLVSLLCSHKQELIQTSVFYQQHLFDCHFHQPLPIPHLQYLYSFLEIFPTLLKSTC